VRHGILSVEPRREHARRLGIPDAAERVLVLAESSHWDPNWMFTSEQYFRFGVRRTLDRVLDELDRDERRVWSADCVFFLAMYWDRCPHQRDRLAAAIESGRIRLTTSGVTTQDTLLPSTESILRDFLIGQEWLRERGMHQEPTLAYFPDSFGHAPTLPSLLVASGFDQAIVTRIDGAAFVGSDWERSRNFPRPESSAEMLTEAGSADFVWRDHAGAEVLAHWHPFTYGQGDMIASVGALRYMSLPTSIRDRSPRRVAARLQRQADRLAPLARTPYLLCPIGMDFVHPIPDLWDLIDEFNEHVYPRTGLWVTNAGADDYLALVGTHRAELPVLELDPNPYWTGFYASRPELKRSHRSLVDRLVVTEAETVAAGDPRRSARLAGELREAWWTAAVGNHHDFVTGTSPDRVVRTEQEPWLASAHQVLDRVHPRSVELDDHDAATAVAGVHGVRHEWVGGVLRVDTGPLVVLIDPARGGALTEVHLDGIPVMRGLTGDLVAHDDSGGLWRMGGEYRGGRFRVVDALSRRAAEVVVDADGAERLDVVAMGLLDGVPVRRCFRFTAGGRSIGVEATCTPGERRTVTLRLATPGTAAMLRMDQPGGAITRPVHRHFSPTFWPTSSWLSADPGDGGRGLALAVDMPRAVGVSGDGSVDVVVARNTTKEVAWNVLPLPACPARGSEPGATTATLTMWWPTDPTTAELVRETIAVGPDVERRRRQATARRLVHLSAIDGPATDASDPVGAIEVLALKPAQRGPGTILRFIDWDHRPGRRIRLRTTMALGSASLCDVRERDLSALPPIECDGGTELRFEPRTAIVSVRLVV